MRAIFWFEIKIIFDFKSKKLKQLFFDENLLPNFQNISHWVNSTSCGTIGRLSSTHWTIIDLIHQKLWKYVSAAGSMKND